MWILAALGIVVVRPIFHALGQARAPRVHRCGKYLREAFESLSPQKEVGQSLQMFNSRLPGSGTGPALSALLSIEEVSSKNTPDPPQLVRDAVKVCHGLLTSLLTTCKLIHC